MENCNISINLIRLNFHFREQAMSADNLKKLAIDRAASSGSGSTPKGGFASLVPEFTVSSLADSLAFWCGLLGFEIAFDRTAAHFAYLTRGPLQIMLCERNGRWEPGEMQKPFGRGINFQMRVDRLSPILNALAAENWPLYEQPSEAWYRTGEIEGGQREFLVQDPDGYLLRFAEFLGTRSPAVPGPSKTSS